MTQNTTSGTGPGTYPPLDPESFNQAYARLDAIANKLRSADNRLDIDALLPDVQAALAAYEICSQRLAAVREALEAQLGDGLTG